MIKGVTRTGFKFEIDEQRLDDWEFVELLDEIEIGGYTAVVRLIKFLLGDESAKKLKAHVKKTTGGLKLADMQEEIMDIMQINTETKN